MATGALGEQDDRVALVQRVDQRLQRVLGGAALALET
jgi:hypothetical protein